ncbi:hypothetical protein RhiJN_22475 [Ceratobasidium sp. AG-Ba]|nr:hypothetical protein RhiJN_22475 [Ceratobasidium sp. AG-Ba]
MSRPQKTKTDAQLAAAGLKRCPKCQEAWNIAGFAKHYGYCKTRIHSQQSATQRSQHDNPQASVLVENSHTQIVSGHLNIFNSEVPILSGSEENQNCAVAASGSLNSQDTEPTSAANELQNDVDTTGNFTVDPQREEGRGTDSPGGRLSAHEAQLNVSSSSRPFKILRHPRPYRSSLPATLLKYKPQALRTFLGGKLAPWAPFRTHADFRFASNSLKMNVSKSGINEYLELHHLTPNSVVTLKNFDELREIENNAANLLSDFNCVPFSVSYRSGHCTLECNLEVRIKSLKNWILEMVLNPQIQPYLHFDAVQKFVQVDGEWVRVVDEPWTADNWARVQATLPSDGLPILLHLYADKAIASSFGTKRLYPVVARLCNLPRDVRNGRGLGGGCVVALLPVVDTLPPGLAASNAADFKCAVWHGAMQKLFDTIQTEAHIGHAVELEFHAALGLERAFWRLFPGVLIASADYEEQIIMACIRSMCRKPCVRCLVDLEDLFDLLLSNKPRDPAVLMSLLKQVYGLNATKTKKLLEEEGYRPVKNAFLSLGRCTNIFEALSYDTLHNNDLGRWGHHIWPMLKEELDKYHSSVTNEFDSRINAVPPWRELNHFMPASSMGFSDGTKYADLLKVVLHGMIGLPAKFNSLVGLIRVQAELRILMSLDVHTEHTIMWGRGLVARFHVLSLECTKKYKKNFSFPKMHQLVHLFDDIQNKGATGSYSTKPGEQAHRPLRAVYAVSSKKHSTVDDEILRKNHLSAVYELIQSEIDAEAQFEATNQDNDDSTLDSTEIVHVMLCARSTLLTLGLIEENFHADEAFRKFESRFLSFVRSTYPDFISDLNVPLKIRSCKMMKVQYKSYVDWRSHQDILRCTPSAYGKERYDCVLIDSDQGVVPAQLLMVMECQSACLHIPIGVALVLYFDPVYRAITPIERSTGFRQFRLQKRNKAEIVSVKSIIRGALMVPTQEDFLITRPKINL